MNEEVIGGLRPEPKRPKKQKKILWVVVLLIGVLVAGSMYYVTKKPTVAKHEFIFGYGEEIPTNSAAYFHHGFTYEDVDFDPSLFAMEELGTYEVTVTYAGETYVLNITIEDQDEPVITFNEEDPLEVLEIGGEIQAAELFTIEDLSAYTFETKPLLSELQNGEQELCVTATDAFENKSEACKNINLSITSYTMKHQVSAQSMEELIRTFMQEKNLTTSTFGFFYYSPDDKEEYIFNDTTLFNAASTIKVPLNMLYYDRIASKEIKADASYVMNASDIEEGDGETIIKYKVKQAVPLSFLQEQSIVNSDNTATNMLIRGLGGFATFRKLLTTYDEQSYPSRFYTENVTNMHYMLSVLKHLYEHSEDYQPLLDHMLQASEGIYLQKSTEDFKIAQKYGLYDTYLHTIGIVYTPHPYIVGIYTNHLANGEEIIAELNEWLISYQLQKH